jgi:hypothetical protein
LITARKAIAIIRTATTINLVITRILVFFRVRTIVTTSAMIISKVVVNITTTITLLGSDLLGRLSY